MDMAHACCVRPAYARFVGLGMTIARVRIAPIEQWCDGMKRDSAPHPRHVELPGMTVGILTETMVEGDQIANTLPPIPCAGKKWKLDSESQKQIDIIIYGHPLSFPAWWCEHLLELD